MFSFLRFSCLSISRRQIRSGQRTGEGLVPTRSRRCPFPSLGASMCQFHECASLHGTKLTLPGQNRISRSRRVVRSRGARGHNPRPDLGAAYDASHSRPILNLTSSPSPQRPPSSLSFTEPRGGYSTGSRLQHKREPKSGGNVRLSFSWICVSKE